MKQIQRKVSALEMCGGVKLSPRAKQWLGWPLSDQERSRLTEPMIDTDPSKLSGEARTWLGI
jgi:hypothetical protein